MWWLAGLILAGTLAGPVFNVVIAAHTYEVVPDELMARVRSVVRLVAWGTIPVGSLLGGLAADALGGRTALLLFGLAMLPVAVLSTLSPGMRRV